MSNTIKRTVIALALTTAAIGAGAGVASADQNAFGGWFNAGVGGVNFLSPGASQDQEIGTAHASCNPFAAVLFQC